jgi:acetolactate synthase-1/2/3 large subunit
MNSLSDIFIKDLMSKGFKTYFGVQGGAAARIIESVVKLGGTFHPVLNEQAAGYAAHGYFLANRRPAGVIFTTGPGLTNGVSGIAACYYDRVPLVAIVGQVNRQQNLAKKTKTRMVGFQELPHLDITKPISDLTFKLNSLKYYKKFRKKILEKNFNHNVSVFEFPDDAQREKTNFLPLIKSKTIQPKFIINKKVLTSLKNSFDKSKKIIFLAGLGYVKSENHKKSNNILKKYNCNLGLTWGAQSLQRYKGLKTLGLFGNHSPGKLNQLLNEADLVIAMGASLLQHQTLKIPDNFAKNSKIVFINSSLNECKRAKNQFGKRLIFINADCHEFIKFIKNNNFLQNLSKERMIDKNFNHSKITPVETLKSIFEKIDYNKSVIFSDAGATLSWSFQASNLLVNCAPIYTSFNLHSMGYANCAGVGAALLKNKDIYVVIGDGSLPMNSQELAWLNKCKVKLIIIDNNGYGIIRQMQKQFYKSNFLGSDFKNKKSKLPIFSVTKILKSFDIKYQTILSNNKNLNEINSLIKSKESKAIIIKTNYLAEVET